MAIPAPSPTDTTPNAPMHTPTDMPADAPPDAVPPSPANANGVVLPTGARSRVLVVLGHPSNEGFCAALADAYAQAAQLAGHEVRVLRLGSLRFDPILHEGYRQVQPLEPDLASASQALTWADHTAWVYPIWWGSVPALLKGFLDRVFLPGFAFKFRPGKALPDPLLKGRTAHLLVTMDTPPWYFRWVYRAPGLHQMARTTLAFCGIRPVGTLAFGPVVSATAAQREAWLARARVLAKKIN